MSTEPTPIPLSSLTTIEWPTLLDHAIQEARSLKAKDKLNLLMESRHWAQRLEQAIILQAQMEESELLLEREGLWSGLMDLADADPALDRLNLDAVLEVPELVTLKKWCDSAQTWRNLFAEFKSQPTLSPLSPTKTPHLIAALSVLPNTQPALKILSRIITIEGELSEQASPKLAELFDLIRRLKKEITQTLEHCLKTYAQKGVLQENFSDVRDGRFVLPVKISHQNDIDGIVYEASASQRTVFVEPAEVSALNNRLRKLQNDLLQETFVVLSQASKELRPLSHDIAHTVQVLAHWDSLQARARVGRFYGGRPIEVVAERRFKLQQCVHPLLYWAMPASQIIKNDVELDRPTQTLLLTGPNTGGKTVLLKTLGLAAICARTGFPFPHRAHERSQVPFFDHFFIDVGDPQSIEQHLSTFAGHMKRFKNILENMTTQSLVLLDELNSATDPEEGAALGRAFLETIMDQGALVVSTTHDPHLKALATQDSRIMVASMAFDEAARSPTYRMILGVPGRSRALETAERLGLPQALLAKARQYVSSQHKEFEDQLQKIEQDHLIAKQARVQAQESLKTAQALEQEWKTKMDLSAADLITKTRTQLRRITDEAQEKVREAVRLLEAARSHKDLSEVRLEVNQNLKAATELADQLVKTALNPQIKTPAPVQHTQEPNRFTVGATVAIPKWKTRGLVIELDLPTRVKVQAGILTSWFTPSELEVTGGKPTAPTPRSFSKPADSMGSAPTPPDRLDLRGLRYEEAMSELARYIDLAYRSRAYSMVTVVHGLGSGALRDGTHQILAKLPYVKEYRDGGQGGGGTGATLIEFER